MRKPGIRLLSIPAVVLAALFLSITAGALSAGPNASSFRCGGAKALWLKTDPSGGRLVVLVDSELTDTALGSARILASIQPVSRVLAPDCARVASASSLRPVENPSGPWSVDPSSKIRCVVEVRPPAKGRTATYAVINPILRFVAIRNGKARRIGTRVTLYEGRRTFIVASITNRDGRVVFTYGRCIRNPPSF